MSQEEPEDYPFPLTLKQKAKGASTGGAADGSGANTPTLVPSVGNVGSMVNGLAIDTETSASTASAITST